MAVSVENVSFAYRHQNILKNISFKIKKGDFIGIFGPNGGGKTTLLKLLMGFIKPNTGNINILGMSPQEAQKQIAYVPQNLRFDRQFPISVMELVLSGRLSHLPWYGRYSHKDEELALQMLEKLGLKEMKDHSFGSLSGGQAQRALIARALISNPEILILDEPTASVDANAEKEIYTLLDELKGKITILMVTHHLHATINHVDRVLCVCGDVIELQPDEVCEHFAMGLYHPPLVKTNCAKESCK